MWSARYLWGGRQPRHDRAAAVAIELGLLFGVLATVTGALWARIMWGAYWNWDPRQTSLLISLLFYTAYLALRSAIDDENTRGRLGRRLRPAGHGGDAVPVLGGAADPNDAAPGPGGQHAGEGQHGVADADRPLASGLGFTALFFWIHDVQCRLQAHSERRGGTS